MKTKKSMFITTILMVAVLIVAVSTATFAWYTSATQLEATTAVVSSASSTSADIAITKDLATPTGTSIALTGTGDVLPMVPTDLIEVADESVAYTTSPMNLSNQFIKNGETATPWVSDVFYVVNHNINNPVTVTMSAAFSAGETIDETSYDLSDHLCVAVFVNDAIAGVFAKGVYYYGAVKEGEGDANLTPCETSDILVPGTNTITISNIPAKIAGQNNYAKVQVYAWIDGADLTSAFADKDVAGFSFSFAAAQ